MKKIYVMVLAAVMLAGVSFKVQALEDQFQKGTIIGAVNFGVMPGGWPLGLGGNLTCDYVLVDEWWKGHFTVGGFFGYGFATRERDEQSYSGAKVVLKQNYSAFSIMPRATYGLNITQKFEVHAGVMTGIAIPRHMERIVTNDDMTGKHTERLTQDDVPAVAFDGGVVAGLRLFFTDNIALSAELMYSPWSCMQNVGLAFKF